MGVVCVTNVRGVSRICGAEVAEFEKLQYCYRADKVDQCIGEGNIKKVGSAHKKTQYRNEQYCCGAGRIDRQYAII